MMSGDIFTCGNREALVAYLYDECDAENRVRMAAHLSQCGDCSDELASLLTTRRLLTAWTPPEVDLGFRLPEGEGAGGAGRGSLRGSGGRPQWWRQPLPAWAQLAAAVAIFAAGLAAGSLSTPGDRPAAAPGVQGDLAAAVADLDARVRGIEAATDRVAPQTVRAASTPDDLMPRVSAQMATFERRIRGDLVTREEVARVVMQFKREEALERQQMREEFQTGLNDVSRIVLRLNNAE